MTAFKTALFMAAFAAAANKKWALSSKVAEQRVIARDGMIDKLTDGVMPRSSHSQSTEDEKTGARKQGCIIYLATNEEYMQDLALRYRFAFQIDYLMRLR
jgi:hypothetical protein